MIEGREHRTGLISQQQGQPSTELPLKWPHTSPALSASPALCSFSKASIILWHINLLKANLVPFVSENFLYYKGSTSWSHGRAKTTGEAELALPRPPLCYCSTGCPKSHLKYSPTHKLQHRFCRIFLQLSMEVKSVSMQTPRFLNRKHSIFLRKIIW